MKNIVEAKELHKRLNEVVLIDATNNFMIPEEGRKKHDAAHIPGAFHIDLRGDMVGTLGKHGGRDPLPDDMARFAEKLERLGIDNDTPIVVYDEDMVPSSRFWWMCKYIGLDNVKVLNGGINAWKSAGYEVTAEPTPLPQKSGRIKMQLRSEMLADIKDIRQAIESSDAAIIDSRTPERYKGLAEPIDKVAGHIPTAQNYFFGEVLDEEGKYKKEAFLKEHYKELLKYDKRIVHCGSGVSGSVNLIAMDEIGLSAKFYIGSWSDYITYEDSVIATEK